jgi:N-acetylmuramoyl-L-alanine amidase CwlD
MSQRAPYWTHVRAGGGAGQPVRYLVVFPNTTLAPAAVGTQAIDVRGVQRVTTTQNGTEARLEFELNKPPTFDVQAKSWGWRFAADAQTTVAATMGDTTPVATTTPRAGPLKTTFAPTPRPTPRRAPEKSAGKQLGRDQRRPSPARPETGPAWANAPDAPLALRKIDGHWQMLLTADDRLIYRTSAVGDDRIRVDIEGGKVALPRDSVYIDNGLIARVRVAPGQGGGTRLTIDLDQPIRHTARLMGNQRSLLMAFHRLGKDRVTLDPGHGGSDSGTVGQKGTREKDVTLAIATKLARIMEANGTSVQMTRMKDLEILLRPRVEMANRNDADVFVSIHANSFGSQHGVNGIETYYFSDESLPLAKSIHKSLLRSLGRPDRGVRKNNFYVVHHTKMPAALIEIGYLSNAEEEALLTSPAYQERAAQAIYAGIKDYMAGRKTQH